MKPIFLILFNLMVISSLASPPDTVWFNYNVDQGETLALVAQRFNVEEAQLMRWNKLENANLKAGQTLIIGTVMKSRQTIATDDKSRNDSIAKSNAQTNDSIALLNKFKGKEILEGGLGAWTEGKDLDHEKFTALHNKAPIGTIIKVENVQTKKVIYVRVVGKITKYDTNNN